MINKIITQKGFKWTLFHLMLGSGCVFYPSILIFWFYYVIISSFNLLASDLIYRNSIQNIIPFIIYISSYEVLGRMLDSSPYIPWELGKYFIIFSSFILIISNRIKINTSMGFVLILLLIPGIINDKSSMTSFEEIINYTLGPISMILLTIVLYEKKINIKDFDNILKMIWYTCISTLIYVLIKTPDYSELTFSLNADFSTTGGFGSNQVATILGVGMFLSFYTWMNRLLFSGYHMLDGIFIGIFAYQGFLTFSRGGMVVSLVGLILYYTLFRTSYSYEKIKLLKSLRPMYYFLFTIIILGISYGIIQIISEGNITLRYLGETQATLTGQKIRSIDTFTTGRYAISLSDLNLWYENFILGVGAGASKFLREGAMSGIAPHTEFSRLLAEHGLLGLIFIFLLIFIGIKSIIRNTYDMNRAIIASIFFVGIATTMHSSMRTYVTAVFFSLSTMILGKYRGNNNYKN